MKHREPVFGEDVFRHIRMFDTQGERRLAARACEKRIDIVNIELGFEERLEDVLQLPFEGQFDGQHMALHKGKTMLVH